jgi:RNA polymerase sigma-70 factor (ECF subfamily)
MDDRRILQLLWARLDSGLDALQKKYGKRLLQTAMNILGDRRDAEEAVNDTYLALWNAIPPARPDPLCAYVYRTGRNTALKHLHRRDAGIRCSRYDTSLDELADILPGGTLEEAVDARQLGQAINRFLGTLSPENRRLFIRRYWFGDDLSLLAKELGSNPGALSVRLSRIRSKLKTYLITEGFL